MAQRSEAQWQALERRYALDAQTEWQLLLEHFALVEGFAFVVLLIPDADGADLCRRELEKHLSQQERQLQAIELATPEELRQLPSHFLSTSLCPDTACLWVSAVVPDYAPDFPAWRSAWEFALARLNAFRNPIRDQFGITLIFAGAPWLQEVIRETAPDLWSVRTLTVHLEPIKQLEARLTIGPYRSQVTTLDPEFAVQQAHQYKVIKGRELDVAKLLLRAGKAFSNQGDWRRAEQALSEALQLKEQYGDKPANIISTLIELSRTYHHLGSPHQSLQYATRALELAENNHLLYQQGDALNTMANALMDLGDSNKAIELYNRALSIAEQLRNTRDVATTLNSLGAAYGRLGQPEVALSFHEKALRQMQQLGDSEGQLYVLINIAGSYNSLGQTQRAIELDEQALTLSRSLHLTRAQIYALNNIGVNYDHLGEYAKAIEYFNEALTLSRAVEDRRGEAYALNNLANAMVAVGKTDEALNYHSQAIVKASEVQDLRQQAVALASYGDTLMQLGQRHRAIEFAEQAVKIFQQINDPLAEELNKEVATWISTPLSPEN